jgi:hypothetical protein
LETLLASLRSHSKNKVKNRGRKPRRDEHLIPDDHNHRINIVRTMIVKFFDPLIKSSKGYAICDIIHHNNTGRSAAEIRQAGKDEETQRERQRQRQRRKIRS